MTSVSRRNPELSETERGRLPTFRVPWAVRTRALATHWGWLALGMLLIGGGVLALAQTRGTVFADDEWIWILQRRGGSLGTYLQPHQSHFSLVPIVIYKLLFATVGIRHYWPYRVIVTAAHLGVVALVFAYARRRVGDWLALLAAALLVFFGPGWQEFLWPFQMAWLIALGAGVAALLALDRRDRAGDVAACILLMVSLASAGPGLAVAAGLVVELGLQRVWRRLWIVGIPILLYAIWWLAYQQTNISHDSIFYVTRFVFDAASGVFSSLAGVSGANALTGSGDFVAAGAPLLVLATVALIWHLYRTERIPVRIVTLLTMLVAFWLTAAIARAYVTLGSAVLTSTGDESRYLYIGAALVLLLGAEALRGVRFVRAVQVLAGVATLFAVLANIQSLRFGGELLRAEAAHTNAELAALDIARPVVSPGYVSQGFIYGILNAGAYFKAQAALGTPGGGPEQITAAPESARAAADSQLVAIHRVTLPALPARFARGHGAPPVAGVVRFGTVSTRGPCLRFTPSTFAPAGANGELELTLPATGLSLEAEGAPMTVELRRFAALTAQTVGTVRPGGPVLLRIGPDLSRQPWHVRILPQAGAMACSLG